MLSTNEINYYDFGEFRLDVVRHQLLKDGKLLTLTHKAFSTLLILVKNAGRIVEKEDLISELWADSFVEESNLSQYVYVLRKILGNDSNGNPYIETITKRGFRFTAQVTEVPADFHISNDVLSSEIINDNTFEIEPALNGNGLDHISFPPSETTEENKNTADEFLTNAQNKNLSPPPPLQPSQALPGNQRLWLRLFVLAVLIPGLIPVAIYVFNNPQTASQDDTSEIKSIAVLPFKQIGEENGKDKLGLGMADSIITHLSRTKLIPVRPTSTIFHFADKANVNSVEVGENLQVDAVLEGTILRENERVRVSVKLINVKSGEVFWAENFNENFTNIIALQDSISNTIAKSLSRNLFSPASDIARSTSGREAYQSYLPLPPPPGNSGNIQPREGLGKAARHFQKTGGSDCAYTRVHLLMPPPAGSDAMPGYYGNAGLRKGLKKSRLGAEKALSLATSFILPKEKRNPPVSRREKDGAVALNHYSSARKARSGFFAASLRVVNETTNQMASVREPDPPRPRTTKETSYDVSKLGTGSGESVKYFQTAVGFSSRRNLNYVRPSEVYSFGAAPGGGGGGKYREAITRLKALTDSWGGDEKNQALGGSGGLPSYYLANSSSRAEEKIFANLKPKVGDPLLYEYSSPVDNAPGKIEESLGEKAGRTQSPDNSSVTR